MGSTRHGAERDLLIDLLDEAYDRAAWHGPGLRGALRGVGAAAATWRPAQGRHSIWELVLHCAYWKHAVRCRIGGARSRHSFGRPGRNWLQQPATASVGAWRRDLGLLHDEHTALRAMVSVLAPAALRATRDGATVGRLVMGIAAHDLYHAGQIRLLRRLADGRPGASRG